MQSKPLSKLSIRSHRQASPHQAALRAGLLLAVASCVSVVHAQIIIPANNLGTDGVFNPTSSITIPLATATTGHWEDPGNGNGIYDPEKWAVVYKFTSVNIPSGVTVRFANHPSGAPVVWLVSGDVVINGSVNLNGAPGTTGSSFAQGGPGGFRGGIAAASAGRFAGLGPGGGQRRGGAGFGSYGRTPINEPFAITGQIYGTADLVPLIGGSGGGARNTADSGGGAGGGAILIVSTNNIQLNGSIVANGGNAPGNSAGAGSGGGIRLVSDNLTGIGTMSAVAGNIVDNSGPGGVGRIRTESNFDTLFTSGVPDRSRAEVGMTARLWPESNEPSIRVVDLGNEVVPADPRGLITYGNTDVELQSQTPAIIRVEAQNIPLQASVVVRVVPLNESQNSITVPASFVSGTFESSIWEATLPLGVGVSAFQATVTLP